MFLSARYASRCARTPGKHISSISFVNKEFHGLVIEEKSSTFDLLCTDKDTGEGSPVELQNTHNYDKVMTNEIDKMCEISFARKEGEAKGKAEGRAEGKAEMAKALKELGVPADKISRASGLTPEEIERM